MSVLWEDQQIESENPTRIPIICLIAQYTQTQQAIHTKRCTCELLTTCFHEKYDNKSNLGVENGRK